MIDFHVNTKFASPIITGKLPNCEDLNTELTRYFLSLESEGEKHRNPHKTPSTQVKIFESAFDLFAWKEPCVQTLKRFCMESVWAQVAKLNNYTHDELKKLRIHCDSWFHVTEYGGYIAAHNHPNASWSGVYCVYSGKYNPDHPEGGVLRFNDARPNACMYLDPGNVKMISPFNNGSFHLKQEPGMIILFPSYLVHEVTPYFGEDGRITVAFNCWFTRVD